MKIDYSYLQPPRQAYKIKRLKQDQFQIIDEKPYRKLFQNVKYNNQQIQKIQSVKQYLKQKQPNKTFQDSFILKMIYLSLSTFSPLNVLQNIKKHQQWFNDPLINTYRDNGRRILQEGTFYSYGRDIQYSPIVYFYPCQLNPSKFSPTDYLNALNMLIQPIQSYMLIPGITQSFNIIIDFQFKQFSFPLSAVRQMIQKTIYAYPFRLKRLFFVNTNMNMNNQLVKCLKDVLRNFNYHIKPEFINKMEEFRKYISDEEREEKYAGNLPDLNQYWPISLATKFEQEKSYFLIENTSQTDYKSVINQQADFQVTLPSSSFCGNLCGSDTSCQIY